MQKLIINGEDLVRLSSEVLCKGGCLRFKAHGSSMYPFIGDGNTIVVQPVDPDALREGTVIFYRTPDGRAVAHRVIAYRAEPNGHHLLTRGDAPWCQIERVELEQVLGQVVTVERERKTIHLDRGLWRLGGIVWQKFPFLRQLSRLVKKLSRRGATGCLRGPKKVPI